VSPTLDLAVRGGVVVDGTGAARRPADVGVRDGRIVEVGALSATATRTVDATGCVVAPGFIDPHTHLDAQLCWDAAARPTCLHGVTSVVIGLCGFGVAPCPRDGGDYLLRSLEVVEEIPYETTSRGVPFEWASWPEYRAFLGRQPLGVNVGALVPHSALRYAVMGERARGEPARADDRAALADELRRALAGGALGFATSRGPNHVDAFGDPVPSRFADDAELEALVTACRGRVWQINVRTKFSGDARGLTEEVSKYARWSAASGARLTWSPLHAEPGTAVWSEVLRHNDELNRDPALVVAPQVATAPITTVFRFDQPSAAAFVPGWGALLDGFFELAPDAKQRRLSDPSVRAALKAAPEDPGAMFAPRFETWVVLASRSDAGAVGRTVAAVAAERRVHPVDALCDLLRADDLGTMVQVPAVNRDHAAVRRLVADGHTLVGLGDAGAHVTSINNFSYPSQLLTRLVRDEGALPLELAVSRMTARPAAVLGLADRGRIDVGWAADLTVFDLDRLRLGRLGVAHDLPGGAPRLFQDAAGYRMVAVNGTVTIEDDQPTGERPGQLVDPAS
jgi:N-acyl-D-aspartate/D-glutamate deacylase